MAPILEREETTQSISSEVPTRSTTSTWKFSRSNSLRSSCGALRVKHPADIIHIFQADDDVPNFSTPVTKFWTGSQADEDLLAQGEYVLVEIQNRSNLIFKNKTRKSEENPKLLMPIHTAEHIGFSRLANVGPVVQKTADRTFTMQKVDSEESCKGSTVLYLNNEIFRLHTELHDKDGSEQTSAIERSNPTWVKTLTGLFKLSFRDFFSLKMLFIMLFGRYGMTLANEKYQFVENDSVKFWLKEMYVTVADCLFSMDKSPAWYETLWSWF